MMLVDPSRIKNVPGRKTDVLDCQWLQQLHTYGLLSGAFRPEDEIRSLRSYLRQRAMLVEYASHHVQHVQKALTQMNLKLQHVISNITGKTGMRIIETIVMGEQDPWKLATLRDPRTRADQATIAKSLQGHWREEHIFELTQALELYRGYQTKIAECDREIERQLERFEDRSDGDASRLPDVQASAVRSNAPRFDRPRSHLHRMTGVDLTRIDGVDAFTALKVVGEIGTDMTRWPSAKHFASWLGLSPNNRITGGKVIGSKTKASANRAAKALRLAANALHRSDRALGAFLRRKKSHLGSPPRPSRPRRTSWPGSSTRCCATASNMWMPGPSTGRVSTGRVSTGKGRSGPPSRERRNWATGWSRWRRIHIPTPDCQRPPPPDDSC